jgi:hypothetical protein
MARVESTRVLKVGWEDKETGGGHKISIDTFLYSFRWTFICSITVYVNKQKYGGQRGAGDMGHTAERSTGCLARRYLWDAKKNTCVSRRLGARKMTMQGLKNKGQC